MKISRLKKVQKNLNFYTNNYKFRQPYQVLVDGTFSFAALENKFNIKDQLPKYFQAEVKLLTTQCVILETEKLGSKVFGAMLIIKQFPVHKCGHEKNPTSGSKCLLSMLKVDNPSRYLIATQDRELQDRVRQISGVPLIYLHGKAPTLEPPSRVTKEHAEKVRQGVGMNSFQDEIIKSLKVQSGLTKADPQPKKKKKIKGPNPLSCKKKQKKTLVSLSTIKESGKIRKRKKVKIPAHVKEVLKSELPKAVKTS
ncbi:rRNA-processing protein UTP23 homolog [Orussus abietinus]|uniref:rRNA-processing protein UTP23 homolog n=1 Tax=Orussus abietinus TaxID=222816 RepID=UPI000624FED9|nr:rRNA-processing protein UTP23 homolog [Orussus abietinus]